MAITTILAIIAIALIAIVAISPRTEDGASTILGYEARIVETDSMADNGSVDTSGFEIGSFDKDTLVVIERIPDGTSPVSKWYGDIEVGDVLTVRYTYNEQITITHRVTEIKAKEDGSGYVIKLMGDNGASDASRLTQTIDTSVTDGRHYVMGKVVWTNDTIGSIIGAAQRGIDAIVNGG